MRTNSVYVALCLAGVVIPYWSFAPWLLEHGLNLRLFLDQLFANRIGAFFGADVLVSAVGVVVFAAFERRRLGARIWLPVLALLVCGVSLALPLLLYLRERESAA